MRILDIKEFLKLEIPPRERILPWMPTQSLTMIYAWRGTGKTHVALGVAYAVASGSAFLCWEVNKPRKVLYIDGELPACEVQSRLASIVNSAAVECIPEYLRIITPDLQELGMPDLATLEGQLTIDEQISDAELIIVDNLSCLVRGNGKENEAESWVSVQQWALKHRSEGRSILFIHHSGKNGSQRGTSKKEDLLDAVICLKRPSEYQPNQGAVFEVHYEKARHLQGDELNPFEVKLVTNNGKQCWEIQAVESTTYDRVIRLKNEGLTPNDIAMELEINKSTVSRHLKSARERGSIINGA
jgi:AAA domain/Bacterial regulatory protein, arsR family